MISWWNDNLMKWEVDEMRSWWNEKLMKWEADEMKSWWNEKLVKWKVDELTSWCDGKLTKWEVDKMASWHDVKLRKWLSTFFLTIFEIFFVTHSRLMIDAHILSKLFRHGALDHKTFYKLIHLSLRTISIIV